MGLILRMVLVWLLVLAVPAQGAAAVTMAFCGPNHHAGAHADAASQGAAAESAGHHDHHDAVDHTLSPPDQGTEAAQQKCSACASCCTFGAILSPVLEVPVLAVIPTVFHAVVPSVDAFAADGPDRPPRIAIV